MKKLNICMVTSEFPPNCAGIGYSAYHLAKSLVNKGHKISVITRGKWLWSQSRSLEGIKVYDVPFIPLIPPFHIYLHSYFVNKLVKKIENGIDIFHLHSPLVPIISTQKPVIVTVHSTWIGEAKFFTKITDWYSLAVMLFKDVFIKHERKVYSTVKTFIAISSAMRNELAKNYSITKRKIRIIRNSIDVKDYANRTLLSKSNKFNVVFVGRLVYRKGVMDIVEAANIICKKYPEIHFQLIGSGPMEKKLSDKINQYRLNGQVKLSGSLPNHQVKDLLLKSSVFVLPSYYEGLPMVLLEAIASGIPIIASNIDGINEVITNNKNGLLVPRHNPLKLSASIRKIYKNASLAKKLSRLSRKSSYIFDRNVAVNKTLFAYRELCR